MALAESVRLQDEESTAVPATWEDLASDCRGKPARYWPAHALIPSELGTLPCTGSTTTFQPLPFQGCVTRWDSIQ